MSEKIPCLQCGAEILPSTATRTNGLCMPCKGGYRQSIEDSKRRILAEREAERTDPFRKLWLSLVMRVHDPSGGFGFLAHTEKLYYAVRLLDGEVYNGGFHQYFFNSSSTHYAYAEEGLIVVGADRTLELLLDAKELVFPGIGVPEATGERRQALRSLPRPNDLRLAELDSQYYKDPDGLADRIEAFAREHNLVS